MNAVENIIYQQMVRYLRYQTDLGSPKHWPGKSRYAVAVTYYPNILAEVCAAICYPNIDRAAEFAGVSREIIAAVIEDNEELSDEELDRLAWRWNRGPVGYLSSPVLQLIDPLTNKGKTRRRLLSDLMERAAGVADKYTRQYAERVLEDMTSGNVITYAQWHNACRELELALYWHKKNRKHVRTVRMATA